MEKKSASSRSTIWAILVFSVWAGTTGAAVLGVSDVTCEYKNNPVGIDEQKPRLSWKLVSDKRGTVQSAYEIRAAGTPVALRSEGTCFWITGRVKTDQSIHIEYGGPALASGQRVYWQVRVWDNWGNRTDWSPPAFWEMGLLSPSDWKADWIRPDTKEDTASNPCPMLRREFELAGPVRSARAYITALGLYEAELNGNRIGDQLFTPGWTAYASRLQYQAYDVTPLLKPGKNAVGVVLGDGWYRGYLAWTNKNRTYGDQLALLLQIRIQYENGREEWVVTNSGWKSSTGPIRMSDIYMGETFDARLEKSGWSLPGYDDSNWFGVKVAGHRKDVLVAPAGPPVKRIEEIRPVKIFKTPAGDTVADMGQNMVGWIRLKVRGPAGTEVVLRHAEVLDKDGNFYTENLRSAKQTVRFILKGGGVETFEPHFTFQGFRYVAVSGYPDALTPESLTGVVVHSEIPPTGAFSCSNAMVNQLVHNIRWGQKGNFVDVPTDCPQRDERLGWMGDAQVFARTACFNADVAAFYTKWLRDVAADQQPSGAVPHVIPNVLSHGQPTGQSASAGWADAAVIVPWTVYLCYGDKRILERQYASMKAWVDYMHRQAMESWIWKSDFTFGDWLCFHSDRSDYPGAATDKDLIATAYFARSTDLLGRAAAVLGKQNEAKTYNRLYQGIRTAFQNEFVTANGRLASNTQTAYTLALAFDLLPESQRTGAAARLAADVRTFKHLTTGFLGTPLLCPVLTQFGYIKEAYLLLNRTEYPSWLYPITRGATTIWERWDGIRPNGTFQDKGMNSFNHYAYGAIGEWLYRFVAGIEIDEKQPGYKHAVIQPLPGGGLTWAKASLLSPYGRIASSWEIRNASIRLEVEIPPNTTASVVLPPLKMENLMESGKPLTKAEGLQFLSLPDKTVLEIGSGRYLLSWPVQTEESP